MFWYAKITGSIHVQSVVFFLKVALVQTAGNTEREGKGGIFPQAPSQLQKAPIIKKKKVFFS